MLNAYANSLNQIGRGERIRTSDHVHPMHVRYQAALRPEALNYNRASNTNKNIKLKKL
jgi:hypothetical protein